jgi:hypothetical protein
MSENGELKAFLELHMQDSENGRCSTAGAICCVLLNLIIGAAVTALLGVVILTEPPTHPCKIPHMHAYDCAADLAGRAGVHYEDMCGWAGGGLLCPMENSMPNDPINWATQKPADVTGSPLFSMEVKTGGFGVFGTRFFQRVALLAVWKGENPASVASRFGTAHGISSEADIGQLARLVADAARKTRTCTKLKYRAVLSVQTNGKTTPLTIFSTDDPINTANIFGSLHGLNVAEIADVSRAIGDALRKGPTVLAPTPSELVQDNSKSKVVFTLQVEMATGKIEPLVVRSEDTLIFDPWQLALDFGEQWNLVEAEVDMIAQELELRLATKIPATA